MSTSIELAVLGPFRARVDGEDVTHALSRTQRTLLALLAAAWRPVDKLDLGHAAGFAATSVDSQLSRLRKLLRAPRRLHRSRHATPGAIDLDPDVVATDVARYQSLLADATEAYDRGDDDGALALLLAAEELWRGEVLDGIQPVQDAAGTALVASLVEGLRSARRRCRELAARCWLAGTDHGLGADRLLAWASAHRESDVCWSAATLAVLARDGVAAARQVAAEWRVAASVERDAAGSARFGEVTRLIGTGGPPAHRLPPELADLLQQAEDDHLGGRWDDAERVYATAADRARADGDLVAEAEVALAMARLTWDPGRFGGQLETHVARIVDALPADETELRARLYACLAGGLHQDGSVRSDDDVRHARRALELVSSLGDPLTAAEVLSRARKALIDIDEPERQIERSGWILNQAGGSDYHRSLGHLAMIVDSLLLDRVAPAREHTELYREIAERTRSPFHGYHVATLDGLWALHDRRYTEVARATARAQALGAGFGGVTVVQVVEGQRLWSACEQGDVDEVRRLRPLVERGAQLELPIPLWELTAAYVDGLLGEDDRARQRLRAVAAATRDFTAVPRGARRIAALALGALVCDDLAAAGRDVRAAARGLHASLVAHPAVGVLVGWPTVYLGPKDRFVRLAAGAAGL
jgi:hypothetical protein